MGEKLFKIMENFLFPKKIVVAKPNDIMLRYEEIAPAMQFAVIVGYQCCVAVEKGIVIKEDILHSRNKKKFCRMWIPLDSDGDSPSTGLCVWNSLKWNDVPAEGSKTEIAADLGKTETKDNKSPKCLGDKKRLQSRTKNSPDFDYRSVGTSTDGGQMSSVSCQYEEHRQDKSCQTYEDFIEDRTWALDSSVGCTYEECRVNKRSQTRARHIDRSMTLSTFREHYKN